MADYKGIAYLRNKLAGKAIRVNKRYEYYEMKDQKLTPEIVIPARMQAIYRSTLGWCAKAVDSLADRLVFRGFEDDNFEISRIFQMNNPDVLFDSAIVSALISSCCFIYISPDGDGYPRLQVLDGGSATGIMDPITGMLTEGYAILQRDPETGQPTLEAYFVTGTTTYYEKDRAYSLGNDAPYPLLVPIVYRPDAMRPFGHSRISRACMYTQQYAKRILERSDISAEFYSFPQKYALGTDPDRDPLDKWKASISALLEFSKDENGDHPVLGQFTQQSMTPYLEQLRAAASVFAGETGLTLDDLGFVTENPSSAEAIKAAHENLRLAARRAQRTFGTGFLNVGYLAACLRDNYPYQRRQLYLTTPVWEPIFEPDAAMLSAIGDGANKINQVIPGYFNTDNLRDLTGIEASSLEPPVLSESGSEY